METSQKREGDILVLSPVGQIDNETSAIFQTQLMDVVGEGNGRVLIDFARVDYISSAGLRALMTASKKTKAGGGRIAITALNKMVREIYEISRFTLIVPAFDTAAEATAALTK